MFCKNCGAPLSDGANFCNACGAPALYVKAETKRVGNLELGPDGTYRWVYSMSLFKNPTFFFLIWKIFFFIILGIFAFIIIFDAIDWGGFSSERLLNTLKFLGYFTLGMTALVGISYLIYAAIMRGKYVVEFEMNEQGVLHRQVDAQARKARKIGQAAAVMGLATGKIGMVGAGLGAQRTEMYSDFTKVKKVKAYPRRNLIKVNNTLNRNQVYAAAEDFEFVKDFIVSHCPNLKNK